MVPCRYLDEITTRMIKTMTIINKNNNDNNNKNNSNNNNNNNNNDKDNNDNSNNSSSNKNNNNNKTNTNNNNNDKNNDNNNNNNNNNNNDYTFPVQGLGVYLDHLDKMALPKSARQIDRSILYHSSPRGSLECVLAPQNLLLVLMSE
jgi:hypothetical protein